MKKVLIIVVAILLTLGVCVLTACDPSTGTQKDSVTIVQEYVAATSAATSIEQEIVVKSGDTLVSSSKTVYNITETGVTGTSTVKTLNPNIGASELYVEEVTPISIAAADKADKLPKPLAVNKDLFKEGSKFENNELTFSVAATSAASYLGLTDGEAATVASDISVAVAVDATHATAIKAEYTTANGNTVTISVKYGYAA